MNDKYDFNDIEKYLNILFCNINGRFEYKFAIEFYIKKFQQKINYVTDLKNNVEIHPNYIEKCLECIKIYQNDIDILNNILSNLNEKLLKWNYELSCMKNKHSIYIETQKKYNIKIEELNKLGYISEELSNIVNLKLKSKIEFSETCYHYISDLEYGKYCIYCNSMYKCTYIDQ